MFSISKKARVHAWAFLLRLSGIDYSDFFLLNKLLQSSKMVYLLPERRKDLCKKKTMKKYQFKTNINCSSCIEKVTPYLDGNNEIKSWTVDTANPNKVLTIETENLTDEMISQIVKQAGYKAEKLK
jgi:copper chaperone